MEERDEIHPVPGGQASGTGEGQETGQERGTPVPQETPPGSAGPEPPAVISLTETGPEPPLTGSGTVPAEIPPETAPAERGTEAREIVETYRQPRREPMPRERLFLYRRPLPERMRPPEKPKGSAPPSLLMVKPVREERETDPKRLRRKRRKGLRRFAACLLVLVLLSGASRLLERPRGGVPFLPMPVPRGSVEEEADEEEAVTIPRAPVGLGVSVEIQRPQGERLSAQEIYRQVNPSVVLVMAQMSIGASVGTGVLFTSDGYIVTNYHVVDGGEDCWVLLDNGDNYAAKYVGGDESSDLAVLKIDGRNLPAAPFGSSDALTVGDQVYAIGNPLGMELRGTLTDGIVSAINRDVWVENRTMTLIQTNAALNSGNSGGPLVNEYGQVVGINVIKMVDRSSSLEGLGFAIPTSSMERIVNDLLGWGEVQPEPLLGFSVSREGQTLADGQVGLEVMELTEGSAADKAGIRVGDYLLRAGGEALTSSQDLLRIRRRCYVGDRLTVTVWRDGELFEATLELETAVTKEPEEAPWYVQ